MPGTKIKNIVLDVGNTLVYFDYCYFFDGVARLEKRVNARKFKKYFADNKFDSKISGNRLNIKQTFKILKKKFGLRISYSDFHILYCDIFWENPHMKNFLETKILDSGYKIFILSNIDSTHINFIDHNFPYVKLIRKRILSYKVRAIKPDKKIFKHLIQKYDIKPEETVFIDDVKLNILSAKALNFCTVHYTSHKRFLKEFNKLVKNG
ncbi:MAG: HAD-IA family hydrolase [Bacteroidota bacterium]|nr:HAD-IA family hydrolase [Bacteroidota bacterium]